jgi:hypothetical protein
VIRLDDSAASPLILLSSAQAGKVVLITTTVDDSWHDWPTSEAGRVTFPLLMQRIAEDGARAKQVGLHIAAGERIQFRLDSGLYRPRATLRSPDGAAIALVAGVNRRGEGAWLSSPPLCSTGIWELELTGPAGELIRVPYAVNVAEGERVLDRTDANAVRAARSPGGSLRVVPYGGATPDPSATGTEEWWPLAALAIVAVLVAESFAAVVSGRPRRLRPRGGVSP